MNITGGKYNNRKVLAPDKNITRPTLSKVRMSIFNTLYSIIDFEGKSFLDMFAGSGIMGLEALSRGFSKTVSIEKNGKSYAILKQNFEAIGEKQLLIKNDALKIVPKLDEKFDVAYIDPPYMSGIYEKSLAIVNSKIIIIEHSQKVDLTNFEILKQKKYGEKFVTFLQKII